MGAVSLATHTSIFLGNHSFFAVNDIIDQFSFPVNTNIFVYFMRGSIQYEDMMLRTPAERQIFEEFISERLEIEKDSPFPNY